MFCRNEEMTQKGDSTYRQRPREVETDPRFPSGEWTGFWLQRAYAGRQWMRLFLTFKEGFITGAGSDRIGDFDMRGTYDLVTGACSIAKTYHGAHAVEYEGRNEGDGLWIWGLWTIRPFDRGGFHLWPAGEDDPTQRRLKAAKDLELDRPRVRLVPAEVAAG
jgi:hypothetical protein